MYSASIGSGAHIDTIRLRGLFLWTVKLIALCKLSSSTPIDQS